jgi:hypothetical protein
MAAAGPVAADALAAGIPAARGPAACILAAARVPK